MAQDSVFWDGTTLGDAASTDVWGAPYSSAEYSDVYSKLLGSNAVKGFVIPQYGNNLEVTANSPAAMNVLVNTGALFIRGRIYENTAQQTLTIGTADATNPRIDRVVARITFASQTIVLAVLAGTPAATPALPTLTQNATTHEISLGYVWVAAAVASIAATEVHDERIFAANFQGLFSAALQTNLLTNSEFMAFSRLDASGVTDAGSPDGGWTLVGTVTTWANLARPAQMSRGRAVRITAGAGSSGMSQLVNVRASTNYIIKGLVQVTAGDVASIVVTTNSAAPGTITKSMRRTGTWIEYTILYTTESDASTLTLSLLGLNNTDIVDYGQWLIVEGFIPGPFRQIHETIMCFWGISDPDIDGDVFGGDTTITIDFDSDFQGLVLPGTKAVSWFIQVSDTNTGTDAWVGIRRVGSAFELAAFDIHGRTNSYTFEGNLPFTPIDVNNQLDVHIAVGTSMTLGLYVNGIMT